MPVAIQEEYEEYKTKSKELKADEKKIKKELKGLKKEHKRKEKDLNAATKELGRFLAFITLPEEGDSLSPADTIELHYKNILHPAPHEKVIEYEELEKRVNTYEKESEDLRKRIADKQESYRACKHQNQTLASSLIANKAAEEANDIARNANAIAKQANEKSAEANILSKDSNNIATNANAIAEKANIKSDTANTLSGSANKISWGAFWVSIGALLVSIFLNPQVNKWLNNQQKNEPEVIENSRPSSNNSSDRVTHDSKGLGMTDSNVKSLHGSNADAALGEVGAIGVDKDLKSTPHSDQ